MTRLVFKPKTKAPARRVLVVEDDADVRRLLGRGLERAGYAVTLAEHGAHAMELVAAGVPDVVMVDLMMPIVDGVRFLRWLRDDAKLSIPTVAVTSASEALLEEARTAGCSAVVKKPFVMDQVLAVLAQLLPREAE